MSAPALRGALHKAGLHEGHSKPQGIENLRDREVREGRQCTAGYLSRDVEKSRGSDVEERCMTTYGTKEVEPKRRGKKAGIPACRPSQSGGPGPGWRSQISRTAPPPPPQRAQWPGPYQLLYVHQHEVPQSRAAKIHPRQRQQRQAKAVGTRHRMSANNDPRRDRQQRERAPAYTGQISAAHLPGGRGLHGRQSREEFSS